MLCIRREASMIDLNSATFAARHRSRPRGGPSGGRMVGDGRVLTSHFHAQLLESGERGATGRCIGRRTATTPGRSTIGGRAVTACAGRVPAGPDESRNAHGGVIARSLEDQKSLLAQARQELHESFEALSGQALKTKQ